MGLSDEEGDWDNETPQQQYFAEIAFCRRYPNDRPAHLAKLLEGGPPPPEAKDGYWGEIVYYRHHAERGDEECARKLAELEAQGPPD